MVSGKIIAGVMAGVVGLGALVVADHIWQGSKKTRQIATADYALESYRWFKEQSSAVEQVKSQIGSVKGEIADYKKDFEEKPRAEWPFDAREELARKESVLRGYISQYNMLVKDYNTRYSDVSRRWTKGSEPEELKPYLREYTPIQ